MPSWTIGSGNRYLRDQNDNPPRNEKMMEKRDGDMECNGKWTVIAWDWIVLLLCSTKYFDASIVSGAYRKKCAREDTLPLMPNDNA